jgi:hypothetical protein
MTGEFSRIKIHEHLDCTVYTFGYIVHFKLLVLSFITGFKPVYHPLLVPRARKRKSYTSSPPRCQNWHLMGELVGNV